MVAEDKVLQEDRRNNADARNAHDIKPYRHAHRLHHLFDHAYEDRTR